MRNVDIISFTFSDKCGNITVAISYYMICRTCIMRRTCLTDTDYAPVAQGIEHRPPEAGAAVRIRPGVYFCDISSVHRQLVVPDGGRKVKDPLACCLLGSLPTGVKDPAASNGASNL